VKSGIQCRSIKPSKISSLARELDIISISDDYSIIGNSSIIILVFQKRIDLYKRYLKEDNLSEMDKLL
jgi:hypothetical protein